MEDCREYLMDWTISIYLIVELDLTSLYYLKDPTSGGQVFHKTGETCSFKVKKKRRLLRAAVPQISPAVIAIWLINQHRSNNW